MRVIFDTNVVGSGLIWKGTPGKALALWEASKFELVITPSIYEEYRRTLEHLSASRQLNFPERFFELLRFRSVMVSDLLFQKQICTDKNDDKFLAAAISANSNYLVTGDKALLKVKQFGQTKILLASDFIKIF